MTGTTKFIEPQSHMGSHGIQQWAGVLLDLFTVSAWCRCSVRGSSFAPPHGQFSLL